MPAFVFLFVVSCFPPRAFLRVGVGVCLVAGLVQYVTLFIACCFAVLTYVSMSGMARTNPVPKLVAEVV